MLKPSIWLWLYVLNAIFAKFAVRAAPAFRWTTWFLDVDTAPFRSIGVIAAGLTFVVASVAIGLSYVLP